MKFWTGSLWALVSTLLALSLIPACGGDDDDDDAADDDAADDADDDDTGDDDAACSVTDICEFVVAECENQGGYSDVANCENLWLNDCAGAQLYTQCACACLAAQPDSCTDFISNCEIDCWNDFCQ